MDVWHQFAAQLNRLGLLESLDQIAFGMLCDAVAGYLRIREEFAHEELVLLAGDSGYPTPNPLCALMRSQSKAVRELLSDFGMTPTSRTSLTGSTSAEPRAIAESDPLEKLITGMNSPAVPEVAEKTTPRRKAATKKRTK